MLKVYAKKKKSLFKISWCIIQFFLLHSAFRGSLMRKTNKFLLSHLVYIRLRCKKKRKEYQGMINKVFYTTSMQTKGFTHLYSLSWLSLTIWYISNKNSHHFRKNNQIYAQKLCMGHFAWSSSLILKAFIFDIIFFINLTSIDI